MLSGFERFRFLLKDERRTNFIDIFNVLVSTENIGKFDFTAILVAKCYRSLEHLIKSQRISSHRKMRKGTTPLLGVIRDRFSNNYWRFSKPGQTCAELKIVHSSLFCARNFLVTSSSALGHI